MSWNQVDPKYANVVCPWQTPKDIRSAEKFCDRIWASLSEDERVEVFRLKETRHWIPESYISDIDYFKSSPFRALKMPVPPPFTTSSLEPWKASGHTDIRIDPPNFSKGILGVSDSVYFIPKRRRPPLRSTGSRRIPPSEPAPAWVDEWLDRVLGSTISAVEEAVMGSPSEKIPTGFLGRALPRKFYKLLESLVHLFVKPGVWFKTLRGGTSSRERQAVVDSYEEGVRRGEAKSSLEK